MRVKHASYKKSVLCFLHEECSFLHHVYYILHTSEMWNVLYFASVCIADNDVLCRVVSTSYTEPFLSFNSVTSHARYFRRPWLHKYCFHLFAVTWLLKPLNEPFLCMRGMSFDLILVSMCYSTNVIQRVLHSFAEYTLLSVINRNMLVLSMIFRDTA